jgi:Fe(3+) dicitrate transport protein
MTHNKSSKTSRDPKRHNPCTSLSVHKLRLGFGKFSESSRNHPKVNRMSLRRQILFPVVLSIFPLVYISSPSQAQESSQVLRGAIIGRVVSEKTGDALVGANVFLNETRFGTTSQSDGRFDLSGIPAGNYDVRVSMVGYRPTSQRITLQNGEKLELLFALETLPIEFPNVEIIGSLPESFLKIPGSGMILSTEAIEKTHPLSTNEMLRKIPGVCVRDEEGFGIRPNIGIRGLFPTRSTKVLLLEDGVPFAIAPYGDPASYYHPPIHRFNRIEILKGSGQIQFGPQTIGGVINYLTPLPPRVPTGTLNLIAGNRNYLFGQLSYGGRWENVGYLLDYSRKQGKLARENSSTTIQDLNTKFILNLNTTSSVTLKLNVYDERSNVTYPGLTQIEFEENPFQNPFKDDWFTFWRIGTHVIHEQEFSAGKALLSTNAYGYFIKRDWWRQGNNGGTNSTPPPNIPGARTILSATRNDGRNREYTVWGLEPRLRLSHSLFGLSNETDVGLRAHFEIQDRKQLEGNSPTARTGILREDNIRNVHAYSAFFQNRLLFGSRGTISAGTRFEEIYYRRTNNLNGVTGTARVNAVIPGLGATFNPNPNTTVFVGVHRGFAPPRVEDAISNTDGSSVELDVEKSWNYELGVRTKLPNLLQLDVTLFRLDFENQIIPSSLAGGSGTTLTNAGSTLHQGLEMKSTVRVDFGSPSSGGPSDFSHRVDLDIAYTYLPIAEFRGNRLSVIEPKVQVTGNRLTYAPEHLLTAAVGYQSAVGFDVRFEIVYVSKQFSDDLNTAASSPNGRQGIIPQYAVWNISANHRIKPRHLTAFFTVKNLFNKVYIVDRSRGILPGSPRLVQTGLRWDF